MPHSASRPFIWVPGQGPDPAALERMARAFPKPTEPMGEAWFMSAERAMYPQLLGDLDALPDGDLEKALEEIASGTSSFGPCDEWTDWYRYLLPRLVTRGWKPTYYDPAELLFTAFMVLHPSSESDAPYDGFRSDALASLGQYIMSAKFWPDGNLDVVRCLGKWAGPTGIAGWADAGGLLSASLFFCIKYLPVDQLDPWFRSAIAIPDRYWQVQIATWLVGADSILTNETCQPGEFKENASPGIGWSWSHALHGSETQNVEGDADRSSFLPDENRGTLLQIARDWDVEDTLEDFVTDPETRSAAAEVPGLPERFRKLYGNL